VWVDWYRYEGGEVAGGSVCRGKYVNCDQWGFPPLHMCVCVYVHVCMYKDTHAQRHTFMLTSVLRWQSLVGTVKREAGLFNCMNYIIIIVLHKDLTIRYTVENKCIL